VSFSPQQVQKGFAALKIFILVAARQVLKKNKNTLKTDIVDPRVFSLSTEQDGN